MKKRAKQVKQKKSRKKKTRASTKPESRKSIVSVFEHLSFAANALEAEEDEDKTLSEEYAYEQGESHMVQQRGNSLCGTHEPVSFDDLLFLANAAGAEESLPVGIEGDACKQREMMERTREPAQQRGKEGKLFEKKYVRKKRVLNKEYMESTSVRAVEGTSKRSRKNKPSRFVNVNDLQRGGDGKFRAKAGLVQVVKGQGLFSGIKNKTRNRVENAEVTRISSIIPHILGIKNQEISKRKRSQRKGRTREPERNLCETRDEKERVCDQTRSDARDSETLAETANKLHEEEEEENIICIAGTENSAETANKLQEEETENTTYTAGSETLAETANEVQEEEEENTIHKANSVTVAEEAKDVQKPQKEESRSEVMKRIFKVLNTYYCDGEEVIVSEEEEDNEPQEEEDDSNRSDVYKQIMLLLKYKYGNAEKEKAIVSEQEGSGPLEEEEVSNASSCKWWNFKTQSRSCDGMRNVRWRIKKKRNCRTSHETQSNRKILLLALETVTPQFGMLKISNGVTTKKKRRRRRAL